MKKFGVILILALIFFTAGGMVFAEGSAPITAKLLSNSITMIWLIIMGALVFFMQAGFAMVETGLTRAKNASNIMMKNLMDFSVGAIIYWAVGWAIMYGGLKEVFLNGADSSTFRDWMFQVVFAATAATIVSGSMAGRTKFTAYLVYSLFISGIIYPVSGHWIWGGGWLAKLNFHDFAGSTVVHSVGGWAALMGALILGARKGKYIKVDGKVHVKAIPGHNMPLAALGVFILWFGWYGFNAGSTLDGTSMDIAVVAVNTTLAGAAGAFGAMLISWILFGKPDPSMSLNGALAGLVGITAGALVSSPLGAVIVGLIAGIIVVLSVRFIDYVLHIDDPVGAISCHGVCGAWGTFAVGLFATGERGGITGLLYGGGFRQLFVQSIGIGSVFLWMIAATTILFFAIKITIGLRVTEEEELQGLDISEHNAESYYGFQIFQNQ